MIKWIKATAKDDNPDSASKTTSTIMPILSFSSAHHAFGKADIRVGLQNCIQLGSDNE